jgi:transcriptional regulator with XRE-family HTH domain
MFSPQKLKDKRRERGLNRDQVGFAINRTAQMVGFYEQGKRRPPTHVLSELASVLACPVADLFEEARDGEA